MSAFAVIYERVNKPGQPDILNKVMDRLSHRGTDGSDSVSIGNILMGHWHFWTTPEEIGERQPVGTAGLSLKIVLDGRIDNRSEIFSRLELDPNDTRNLSDAALVLISYDRWKESCFELFVGEFAMVIADGNTNELVCVRDQLGDRTLFYESNEERYIIASEPWAVLGARSTQPELNESSIAHYFASRVPEDGQTFFTGVQELLPAHIMKVNSTGCSIRRYWRPDPNKKIRYQTENEYGEHFLMLLEESVRCRMRSSTPVGVLMSGGLDSTSLACLAARMMVPNALTTISNVYDELSDCDEREYINAVKEKWNIRSLQIPCDDAWTYKGWQRRPHNPNQPESNLYRLAMDRDYTCAQEKGIRVLFTGEAGDPLYLAGGEWLVDFILEGRFRDVLLGIKAQIRTRGLLYPWFSGHIRSIVRYLLLRIAPWFKNLRRQKITRPVWLRRSAAKFLIKVKPWIDPALERYSTVLGLLYAYACSRENINASRYNLELRLPYRDRRLVEYMIAIPAYMLHYGGLYKHVLRIAMQGILPESIRTRKKATFLTPLFLRGLEREKNVIHDNLYKGKHLWQQFVDPEWLLKHLNATKSPRADSREQFVAWLCISYEKWRKSFVLAN